MLSADAAGGITTVRVLSYTAAPKQAGADIYRKNNRITASCFILKSYVVVSVKIMYAS